MSAPICIDEAVQLAKSGLDREHLVDDGAIKTLARAVLALYEENKQQLASSTRCGETIARLTARALEVESRTVEAIAGYVRSLPSMLVTEIAARIEQGAWRKP